MEDHDERKGKISATFLLENINSITSFRSECGGVFRSIAHMDQLNMTPTEVKHWCDNKVTVQKSCILPSNPQQMIQADADIILAIHHIKSCFPFHAHIVMFTDTETLKAQRCKRRKEQN